MRILITGGAGYIGSHTIKELIKSGYTDLIVVDDLSNGDKKRIPKSIEFVKGDFSDEKVLTKIFSKRVDYVIHFAAYKLAPESVEKPEKYYDNNVLKSIKLINYCVKNKIKGFIFSSSAAVYGDVKEFPITEEFTTMPTNPYGWTKLMIEQVLNDYANAQLIKHVSLRYFNAGGADPDGELGNNHQKGEDVISILMRVAVSNNEFTIFGNDYKTKDGTCIRDLIHVTDLAKAHINALNYLDNGGVSTIINLGSESGFSIREIINMTKNITKKDFSIKEGNKRDGDIVVSIASSEKAKNLIKWSQEYSDLETIIRTAWEWELLKDN